MAATLEATPMSVTRTCAVQTNIICWITLLTLRMTLFKYDFIERIKHHVSSRLISKAKKLRKNHFVIFNNFHSVAHIE